MSTRDEAAENHARNQVYFVQSRHSFKAGYDAALASDEVKELVAALDGLVNNSRECADDYDRDDKGYYYWADIVHNLIAKFRERTGGVK